MSFQGWLQRRVSSQGGVLLNQFCVQVGQTVFCYDQKEHFYNGVAPKAVLEIIGSALWDGKGRSHNYDNGMVFVTRLGGPCYCLAPSEDEREMWMAQLKVALEMSLVKAGEESDDEEQSMNGGAGGLSLASVVLGDTILEPSPLPIEGDSCTKTGQAFGLTQSKHFCVNCGGVFLYEHCHLEIPLPHHGHQAAVKVCGACYTAQSLVLHLVYLNCLFETSIYEHRMVRHGVKSAFLRGANSVAFMTTRPSALSAGLRVLEEKGITEKEFSELVKAEQRFHRDEAVNVVHAQRMEKVQSLGDDMLGLIKILHDCSRRVINLNLNEFHFVVAFLHDLVEKDLSSMDFFWPQVVHVHFLLVPADNLEGILKVELLEDLILAVCVRSVHLAIKLIWWVRGYLEDLSAVHDPDTTKSSAKKACLMRLALEVESAVVTGMGGGQEGVSLDGIMGGPAGRGEGVLPSLGKPTKTQCKVIGRELEILKHRRKDLAREFLLNFHCKAGVTCFPETGGTVALNYFEEQLRFVQELVDIAERLRFVEPVSSRGERLKIEIARMEGEEGGKRIPGYLPVCRAGDPICPIARIPMSEGYVFKTKARAPTLICCEIINPPQHDHNLSVSGQDAMERMQEVEELMQGYGGFGGSDVIVATMYAETSQVLGYEFDNEPEFLFGGLQVQKVRRGELERERSVKGLGQDDIDNDIDMDPSEDEINPGTNPATPTSTHSVSAAVALAKTTPERLGASRRLAGAKALLTPTKAPAMLHDVLGALKGHASAGGHKMLKIVSPAGLRGSPSGHQGSQSMPPGSINVHNSGHVSLHSTGGSPLPNQSPASPVTSEPDSHALVKEESAAVSQARDLHRQGVITDDELNAVVAKDQVFVETVDQYSFLDTQYCVSLAFGESWASKKARIKQSSPEGQTPGWDLVSIIVKSNDDLRQEVCALQLIGLCKRIFLEEHLQLWLEPYLIISTGCSTGLMQTLTDAMSLDALKKKPAYVSLAQHFSTSYGGEGQRQYRVAQRNLANSLAAYSLVCYIFQIKDRHNGNILLDTEGHIVHIDFGFMLGIAPGGNFSIETSPFKLTADMVSVMGGLNSKIFMEFVVAFTCGFMALQSQAERITSLVDIMASESSFPCFAGKDVPTIMKKLRTRLAPTLDKAATVAHCLALIRESYDSYATRQYDNFQWMTNGIMP